MGRIRKYTCLSCNTSWQITLGHGIGHAVLKSVLDLFPPEMRLSILSDTEGEQIPSFEFNYRPAVCPQCRKVVSVPVIYLHRSGNTYSSACPDCGCHVSAETEETELICPCCKSSVLSAEDAGAWD